MAPNDTNDYIILVGSASSGHTATDLALALTALGQTGVCVMQMEGEIIDGHTELSLTNGHNDGFSIEEMKCEVAARYDHYREEEILDSKKSIKALSKLHGSTGRHKHSIPISRNKERNWAYQGMRRTEFGRKGRI